MTNIVYNIVKSNESSFAKAISQLVKGLGADCIRLIFFVDASSSSDYTEKKDIICSAICVEFGSNTPTWSVVSEKPLDCNVTLEVHRVKNCTITHKRGYIVLESALAKGVIISGACGDVNDSIYNQSHSAFNQIKEIFSAEGVSFSNVVRQWNYIEKIVAVEDKHQHYQDFNDVRSGHYSTQSWVDGYPAATGIGTQFGGIVIDLDAVIVKDAELQVRKIDNDLQIAAHAYSKVVLIGEDSKKTTPKFERAKSLSSSDVNRIYISGTAAITGEESLVGVGFEKQIAATMLNIEHLICESTLKKSDVRVLSPMKFDMFRVYLKHENDIQKAIDYMSKNYGTIPTSYLLGDVCRDELLVEIEGIAYSNK